MKECINQQCDYVDITGETFVSYVYIYCACTIVLCMRNLYLFTLYCAFSLLRKCSVAMVSVLERQVCTLSTHVVLTAFLMILELSYCARHLMVRPSTAQ